MTKIEELEELRSLSKPELAASIAAMVRKALLPEEGWTIEAGRECVEVLLIAARIAYPTRDDIESMGRAQPTTQAVQDAKVSDKASVQLVGRELAEELEDDLKNQTIQ